MASLLSLSLSAPKSSPIRATSSSPATTTTSQSPSQTLDEKFGRKGIKFTQSSDNLPAVELTVRNGSSLSLRLSDGLVTSYKPKVFWRDDGFEEVLYTLPGRDSESSLVKGGIGLVLNDVTKEGSAASPCCAFEWVVKDVDSDSIDALQVELSCSNANRTLEITYVVSLFPVSMATAVTVKNNGPKAIRLTSAILSHLKFKSRNGSAIEGLTGCSYCNHPPLSSSFSIMSPSEAMKPESPSFLGSIFYGSGDDYSKNKLDAWKVEDNKYTMMRNKFSRVYTAPPAERLKRIYRTPPSKYDTIDQASSLGFRVIRMGYDDIYLSTPGALAQKYGKDYFICTGPASMLVPVELNPGETWRGAQVLEHDNL